MTGLQRRRGVIGPREFGVAFTALVPAFVLILGGMAKAADPLLAVRFASIALGVPFEVAFPVVYAVIALELLCGLALCLFITRSILPALAGICIASFLLGLLLRLNPYQNHSADCGCFGSLVGRGPEWLALDADRD